MTAEKWTGLLLAALLTLACTPGYMQRSDDASAVLLRDGGPVCSAFAVGPHEVLTAAHCVVDDDPELEPRVWIVPREMWNRTSRGRAEVEIEHIDRERDLALLRTSFTFDTYLRTRAPRDFEPVNVVSAFADWSSSPGQVLPGVGVFRDADVTIAHGWSGSPVIANDGRAVGVVVECGGFRINGRHFCQPKDMTFSVATP